MTPEELIEKIVRTRELSSLDAACLVGISGIDASGKGHVAARLTDELRASGYRVALINVDGWLNLPDVRFSDSNPGEHFYHHALRLEEMFERLILPLRKDGEVDLVMDFAEETALDFRLHNYEFRDIEIILLEGIFIFKRQFTPVFDLRIWIDCSFETALARAIARGQEGPSSADAVDAYERIYFRAQQFHFATDAPLLSAHIVYVNDEERVAP